MAGTAFKAKILACKALDAGGWGLISKVIECISVCRWVLQGVCVRLLGGAGVRAGGCLRETGAGVCEGCGLACDGPWVGSTAGGQVGWQGCARRRPWRPSLSLSPSPTPTANRQPPRRSRGAKVINTSFVLTGENAPLREAIGNGTQAGVFFAG